MTRIIVAVCILVVIIALFSSGKSTNTPVPTRTIVLPGTTIPLVLPKGYEIPEEGEPSSLPVKVTAQNKQSSFSITVLPLNSNEDAKSSIDTMVAALNKTQKDSEHSVQDGIIRDLVNNTPVCGVIYKAPGDTPATKMVYVLRHYRDWIVKIQGTCDNTVYADAANAFLTAGKSVGTVDVSAFESRRTKLKDQLARSAENTAVKKQLVLVNSDMARLLHCADRFEEATALLLESSKLVPDDASLLERLADSFLYIQSPASGHCAAGFYEEALALSPDNRGLRIKFAASLAATNEYFDAMEQYESLISNGGGTPDGDYVQDLSIIYAALDMNARGIEFFGKMTTQGGDERFVVAQAVLSRGQGDIPQAISLLRGVVDSGSAPEHMKKYSAALVKRYENASRKG